MKKVTFQDLGVMDYKACWDYQEELFKHTIDQKISNRKLENPEDAVTPPLIPEWIPFSNIIFPELRKAILGDKSIKDALDYAAKETAYMMEDAGY